MFDANDGIFEGVVHPSMVKQKQAEPALISEAAKESANLDFAEQMLRSAAMGVVLTWVEEGEHTFDMLETLVEGFADSDESEDLSDEEMVDYEALLSTVGDALIYLGASKESVNSMMTGDEKSAAELGDELSYKLDDLDDDDDEIVSNFSSQSVLVAEAVKKVIRGGEVKIIRTNRRKRRMSSAQKAALKKARKKAHTSSARLARKKSNKIRTRKGL